MPPRLALVAVTLISIGWSLWIRRATWKSKWETAATLNLALQGLAVVLMSPISSATIGRYLHRATGMWSLEDYLGHDCYVVAASAIVYNALARTDDEVELRRSFKLMVELPATFCIPLMMAFYGMSRASRVYAFDFFEVRADWWLDAYWTVLCGTLIWLLGYAFYSLWLIREDERSRKIANVYLIATSSGIAACVIRLLTTYIPQLEDLDGSLPIWVTACTCGIVFALSSAWAWKQKCRALIGRWPIKV